MIKTDSFEVTNGKGLRQIIEVKHEELRLKIEGLNSKTEEWKMFVGIDNCLKVLEQELRKVGDNETVYVTEDLDSYNKNIAEYTILGKLQPVLEMFYVKAMACKVMRGNKFYIVYLYKL